ERVSPAVVSINAIQHRTVTRSLVPRGWEYFERFYPGMFPQRAFRQDVASMGSGVVVSDDGFILTNVHVVESADELVVALNDGRQYSARVLEKVPTWDLALIQLVEPPADLPVATLADPGDDLYIGEWAIAIGSPFGYLLADTQPTVTIGVISALNRDIKNTNSEGQAFLGMIQTDAAINPGNSGGPLVNSRGEVIGINTFIFTESGGSIGLGFAVPIARAQWIIREVRDFGYFRRAYVGFGIVEVNELIAQSLNLPSTDGFVVRDVISGSPAAKAGLQPYDVIISINGVALNDADTFNRLVYEAKVGTQLEFMAYREGKEFAGTIVLEEDPRRRE
ncbi:trypsin-like peptidase domain-containing protein, partial [bacterium]|nr:trypsin-like peptidase domain-containing protein [bacterium]